MRGSSLRSRLFWAIGVVVLICVALTIGLGLVLTQREVKKSALRDLAHQVDLIGAGQCSSGKGLQPQIQKILNQQPQHETSRQAARSAAVGARATRAATTRFRGRWDSAATPITSPRERATRER